MKLKDFSNKRSKDIEGGAATRKNQRWRNTHKERALSESELERKGLKETATKSELETFKTDRQRNR